MATPAARPRSTRSRRRLTPDATVTVTSDVMHDVFVSVTLPQTAAEIAESRADQDPGTPVAVAEHLDARVRLDEIWFLEIRRTYSRKDDDGRTMRDAKPSEIASLMLDAKSWPGFVALVNRLDQDIAQVRSHRKTAA
jgi:hypothetical protein